MQKPDLSGMHCPECKEGKLLSSQNLTASLYFTRCENCSRIFFIGPNLGSQNCVSGAKSKRGVMTKPKMTVEWTEACRSGNCAVCGSDDVDEVLAVDIGETANLIICPDCASQLIGILHKKGVK